MKLIEFRPEQRTYSQTRTLQQLYRASLPVDSLDVAMQEAAEMATELGLNWKVPSPPAPKRKKEVIPPRPKCVTHAERSFTFSSGETKRSCPAEGCLWGTPTSRGWRKQHSVIDPVEIELVEIEPVEIEAEEAEERSSDDPTELSLEAPTPIAGEDAYEPDEPETELGSEVDYGVSEDEVEIGMESPVGVMGEC